MQGSPGNILDDETLIATLETSKASAAAVEQRLAAAGATAEDIRGARAVYAPVPRRAVLLFFAVHAMAAVDAAYQHSLQFFMDLYSRSMHAAEASDEVEVRLSPA